jgi:hypothetical protein
MDSGRYFIYPETSDTCKYLTSGDIEPHCSRIATKKVNKQREISCEMCHINDQNVRVRKSSIMSKESR